MDIYSDKWYSSERLKSEFICIDVGRWAGTAGVWTMDYGCVAMLSIDEAWTRCQPTLDSHLEH